MRNDSLGALSYSLILSPSHSLTLSPSHARTTFALVSSDLFAIVPARGRHVVSGSAGIPLGKEKSDGRAPHFPQLSTMVGDDRPLHERGTLGRRCDGARRGR